MVLIGNIDEMLELFNSSCCVRFYKQIDNGLFEIELRSVVPSRIKTIKHLAKFLIKKLA